MHTRAKLTGISVTSALPRTKLSLSAIVQAGSVWIAGDFDFDQDAGVVTKPRPKTKRPSRYRVLLLNDDYTPMEFVVEILQRIFNKSQDDAVKIMLHVHQNGVGLCGVYTYEVAETKVAQVLDAAKRNQHPLQCTMEKE